MSRRKKKNSYRTLGDYSDDELLERFRKIDHAISGAVNIPDWRADELADEADRIAEELTKRGVRVPQPEGRGGKLNPFGESMSSTQKFLIGLVLGYAGYMAYKKWKGTQTVYVNTLDQPVPSVMSPQYMTNQIV